jgi:hypothetical protein
VNRREFIPMVISGMVEPPLWGWPYHVWYSLDEGKTWLESASGTNVERMILTTLIELKQTVLADYPCLDLKALADQTAFNLRVYGKSVMPIMACSNG